MDDPTINLIPVYDVQLNCYDDWLKDIMNIIRFKQMCNTFNPEAVNYFCKYKYHEMIYSIYMFNYFAKIVFLGVHGAFDKEMIFMRSQYCCVRIYNNYKIYKYRVDFFILAGEKYYFIFHIDVNQIKNSANNGIKPSLHNLPTTQKAVSCDIINSVIANGPNGYIYI